MTITVKPISGEARQWGKEGVQPLPASEGARIPDCTFRFELAEHGSLLTTSGDVEALTGFPANDFLTGKVLLAERVHADDSDVAELIFNRSLDPAGHMVNLRIRTANGRIRCIRAIYRKSPGGAAGSVILELRLDDAKSLPRTLENPTVMASIRAMMENTNDFIYFKDRNHVFTGASQSLVLLCSPAEHWSDLLGKTDYDVFPEPYADIYYRLEKQVFSGVSVAHEIQEYLTTDGRKGWVDNRKYPIHSADGQIIGLFGIARDISQQKRAEDALRESEQHFRTLANSGSALIWTSTPDKLCNYFNETWLAFTGRSLQQEIGNGWAEGVHPDDFDRCLRIYVENFDQRLPFSMEYRLRHADGDYRWIADRGSPRYNSQGEFIGYIGFCYDITEQKAVAEELAHYREHLEKLVEERTAQLAAAKEAAEEANQAKTAFLANMSHELRTPLNGVTGMLALARRRMTDPQGLDHLDKAQMAADHLILVINDVLDISKIEADRLVLDEAVFTLPSVIECLVSLFSHRARAKGLRFETDLPVSLYAQPLKGDPLRLKQILVNIVGNAVKFTHQGAVVVRVRQVRRSSETIRLRFEIEDTGIGISEAEQACLFNAFKQVDASTTRKYGGTGLGLTISQRLAKMMDGNVSIRSTPGVGSTFTVEVSLATGLQPPPVVREQSNSEAELAALCKGRHVLLVEDEPINQEISRMLLEEVGLLVDLAEDGEAAVALAKKKVYDVILMDMQMPHMNGLQASMAIRRDSINQQTPILAMTANVFAEDRDRCLEAGMNDHIGKPIDLDRLFEKLLQWMK